MMITIDFTLRLLAAIGGGFIIGFERQWHHKAAGYYVEAFIGVVAITSINLILMGLDNWLINRKNKEV